MGKFEAVGVGKSVHGGTEFWQITYEKEDGNFHHHLVPVFAFATRAEEYGLDPEEDFDEVFDILAHEAFAGKDEPEDDVEPPKTQGLVSAKGKPDRKNALGRKHARRAARMKRQHDITGLDVIKEKVRPHRQMGVAEFKDRLEEFESRRIAKPRFKEVRSSDKSA
jgi:hypothetical protein